MIKKPIQIIILVMNLVFVFVSSYAAVIIGKQYAWDLSTKITLGEVNGAAIDSIVLLPFTVCLLMIVLFSVVSFQRIRLFRKELVETKKVATLKPFKLTEEDAEFKAILFGENSEPK